MKTTNPTPDREGHYLIDQQKIDIDKMRIEAGWIGLVIGTKNPEMSTLAIALLIILVIVCIFSYCGKFDAIESFILPGVFWAVGFLAGFYTNEKKK